MSGTITHWFGCPSVKENMPQLDFFSYPSQVIPFAIGFSLFMAFGVIALFALSAVLFLSRAYLGFGESVFVNYEITIMLLFVQQLLYREFFVYTTLFRVLDLLSRDV